MNFLFHRFVRRELEIRAHYRLQLKPRFWSNAFEKNLKHQSR
jgi:hypothetical protein